MKYTRVYSDSHGESHFDEVEVEFQSVDFAPPAPPVGLSTLTPAVQWGFLTLPVGWEGDWHPTPRRQIFFYLSGEVKGETSDGEVRRFGPGDVTLVEDTTGKGHRSRVVGTEGVMLAVVQLPE